MTNTEHAYIFAAAAHAAIDQRRKYTNEPYIVHPAAVALIVRQALPGDKVAECAAFLHDVVEDTKVPIGMVQGLFGSDVSDLVEWLTDRTTHDMGNRALRRTIAKQKLAQAPARAQTIKVADLIDNTKTIVEFDPKFAVTYLREKEELLEVMENADTGLVALARAQIFSGLAALRIAEPA